MGQRQQLVQSCPTSSAYGARATRPRRLGTQRGGLHPHVMRSSLLKRTKIDERKKIFGNCANAHENNNKIPQLKPSRSNPCRRLANLSIGFRTHTDDALVDGGLDAIILLDIKLGHIVVIIGTGIADVS